MGCDGSTAGPASCIPARIVWGGAGCGERAGQSTVESRVKYSAPCTLMRPTDTLVRGEVQAQGGQASVCVPVPLALIAVLPANMATKPSLLRTADTAEDTGVAGGAGAASEVRAEPRPTPAPAVQ